jgi:hypothetical protein
MCPATRGVHAVRNALLAFAFIGLGCGGDSGGDPSPNPAAPMDCGPSVPKADAGQRWAESFCATLFSCTCETYADYTTEAECVTAERAGWDQVFASATAAGLTYDGECVGCLIEFFSEDLVCSADLGVFATGCPKTSCSMFHGSAAEGESCTPFGVSAGTCASGLWCNPSSRVCQAWQCAGQPAETDAPGLGESCLEGFGWKSCEPRDEVVCDVAGSGQCERIPGRDQPCVAGKCQAGLVCFLEFPGPTDVCTDPVQQGGECHWDAACDDNLYCVLPNGSAQGGTCEPLIANGASCRSHGLCQSGYCRGLFTSGGAGGTCAPVPGNGEGCDGICAAGFACVESEFPATCRPAGGAGQPCRNERDVADCDDGLFCYGSRCIEPAALGDDCQATSGLCEVGSQCNPTTMKCEASAALICDVE